MSVYRHKASPFFHYDFQHKGRRFHGSTGCTNKREAASFERAERDRARQEIRQEVSPTSEKLDDVSGRYWSEVGQHHAGAKTTFKDLERLVDYFGPSRIITTITDDDVAKLVAWRRGHPVTRHGKAKLKKEPAPLIAPATVNRSTTEVLKKLFTRAKLWGIRFEREPIWKTHFLKEPEELNRELHSDDADKLDAATRADYEPIFRYAQLTGMRLAECLLKWSDVNWDAGVITRQGKGNRRVTTRITRQIRLLLWPLRGHHNEMVFTYIAKRTRKPLGLIKGGRYPITYNGLKTTWKRLRSAAGVTNFRFHDFRHDFATKLLRQTGNLKMVQKALNHSNIKTTTRYAHVQDDDLAAELNRVQESRTKSRRTRRQAS